MRRPLLLLFMLLCLSPLAMAAESLLPRPPELEPDVQFWIRVYTEITTNEGFIHDQHKLSVVYETLHFEADSPSRERERRVNAERERIRGILQRLSHGAMPANEEERRVVELWGADGTPARLQQAAEDMRFQLGQADRFRAGLQRAGAWETHIGEVLANLGLPAEIAALPHVESSFDPSAYSKVGAAGLWQFMRSTGRRFLRIDAAVDERLDPFRETEAAAQLLSYNYRLLGSWPLAITAYNHGAEGVRRAREQLGTDDIVRIVRDYRSPSFGFASRNFYVSFLAALSVAREPEKYFHDLQRRSESQYYELKLSNPANATALMHTLDIDRDTLRSLNPALRPAVWSGQRSVPAGYVLRLPASESKWTAQLLAQRLGVPHAATVAAIAAPAGSAASSGAVLASATASRAALASPAPARATVANAPAASAAAASAVLASAPTAIAPAQGQSASSAEYYLVQASDNLPQIAAVSGVPVGKLMALNSIRDQDDIYQGERLRLFASAPEPETLTSAAALDAAKAAVQESSEEQQAIVAESKLTANTEPVSASQAQAQGPQLLPGATGPQSPDPVDYSVAADGSIRVVAAETLGHYADWLGSSAARLRALNHLKGRTALVVGRRMKLEFAQVTREQFEQRRRDYHQSLQAAYFASHRIAGAEIYIVRRGDSLWNITQHNAKVPVWLLQQYNPDLDFGDLHPGTQVSLPKVEDVSGT